MLYNHVVSIWMCLYYFLMTILAPAGAFHNTLINHHPCFAALYPEGMDTASFSDGEILECEAGGTRYFMKVRTGTWRKDEATLECFSLATLANNRKSWAQSHRSSTITIVIPTVYFYRGPALPNNGSVCVTEYFFRSKQILLSFVRNEIKTQDVLYNSMQAFLDLLLLLKRSGVLHNDLHEGNVVVLTEQSYRPGARSAQFSFLIVDFSFALSPMVTSTTLVDTFATLLQTSGLISATPSGPLCDVYSTGVLIRTLLSRFALDSTRWAYPLVDAMLDRADHESRTWNWQDIAALKEQLHDLYAHFSEVEDVRAGRLSLFSNQLKNLNAHRNFASCGYSSSSSCEELELFSTDGGRSVNARLGPGLEIGFAPDLGISEPTMCVKGVDAARWELIEPVFVDLVDQWRHLDVTVLDVSGGFSYVCVACHFSYNTSCTVLETDRKYDIQMKRALDALPSPGIRASLHYRDIVLTPEHPFEADIVTVLGTALWLHYCVEGNLGHVVKKLAARAREVLIVEWVDSADPAIVQLAEQFPSCAAPPAADPSAIYSPYTLVEFKKAIQADFCGLTSFSIGSVSETRYIALNINLDNHTTSIDDARREAAFMLSTEQDAQVRQQDAKVTNEAAKLDRLRQFYQRLTVQGDDDSPMIPIEHDIHIS